MKQIPTYTPCFGGVANAHSVGTGLGITWQEGPFDASVNGSSVEQAIRACVQRLEDLDRKVSSEYNQAAIRFLNAAIHQLEMRTKDRAKRGVLGTQNP